MANSRSELNFNSILTVLLIPNQNHLRANLSSSVFLIFFRYLFHTSFFSTPHEFHSWREEEEEKRTEANSRQVF